jgi:hypothetical protein
VIHLAHAHKPAITFDAYTCKLDLLLAILLPAVQG